MNYLPLLASNHNPPNLSLPSNQDYRLEPLEPSILGHIFTKQNLSQ
jgi:hypothetical protein